MKIDYVYVNPGGNPTVLVTSKVQRRRQAAIAKKIMRQMPACEQVGFVETAKNSGASCRLQMMGGEFCGNAARALAFWFSQQKFSKNNFEARIESSGTDRLVTISARQNEKYGKIWTGTQIPLPKNLEAERKNLFLDKAFVPAVQVGLDGITHFLMDEKYYESPKNYRAFFERLYRRKALNAKACGLIFFRKISVGKFEIDPIVYVRKARTLVSETSCASGSVALMLGLGLKTVSIKQPSGFSLTIKLAPQKASATVVGEVESIFSDSMSLK